MLNFDLDFENLTVKFVADLCQTSWKSDFYFPSVHELTDEPSDGQKLTKSC